jgi:hypothetical protein
MGLFIFERYTSAQFGC